MKHDVSNSVLLVLTLLALAGVASASSTLGYDLNWWKVSGGGATFSSGGGYDLGGTIGQPDAGSMSGGSYTLVGGFWAIAANFVPPTDTISGNAGVGNATLNYDAGGPQTATADASGNYAFTVPSGWTNSVAPSKTGYSFLPSSKTYSNVVTDKVHQNYTAMIAGAPTIVRLNPPEGSQDCLHPPVGVLLRLTDLVRIGGSFNPASISLTLDGADVTGAAAILQNETSPASLASVLYTPPTDLAAGDHEAILTYPAPAESLFRHWEFTGADMQCQAVSLQPFKVPGPLNLAPLHITPTVPPGFPGSP